MGDKSQVEFGKRFLPAAADSVIEIGSKDYGNTASFRDLYPDAQYIGVDMEEGKGVDLVVDLTTGALAGEFDIGICCSVLEHTPFPWKMAENITSMIKRGGSLYVSVPWVQRWHAYPDDYWRISHSGIKALFPEFAWGKAYFTTFPDGEIIEFSRNVDDMMAIFGTKHRKYLPYLHFNMIGKRV
jgi:hypothetical protein